jgi:hypothetical protein
VSNENSRRPENSVNLADQLWKIRDVLQYLIRIHRVELLVSDWKASIQVGHYIDTRETGGIQPDRAGQFSSTAADIQRSLAFEQTLRSSLLRIAQPTPCTTQTH